MHINEKTNLKYDTINNTENEINIICNDYKHTIPNYGMIRDDKIGNLIIVFNIIFPDKIDREQRKKLNEIL